MNRCGRRWADVAGLRLVSARIGADRLVGGARCGQTGWKEVLAQGRAVLTQMAMVIKQNWRARGAFGDDRYCSPPTVPGNAR